MINDAKKIKEELLNQINTLQKKLEKSGMIEKNLMTLNQQLKAKEQQLKGRQIEIEKDLKLQHYRLENILNSIPYGIYIVNDQEDIEYVNPVIEKDFGPVNGQKCYQYFHAGDEKCSWCKNDVIRTGKSVQWNWYSEKNKRYYSLFDSPIKNKDGSISKFEIFQDITDRKLSEESLKALNEQLIANEQQLRAANQQLIASEIAAKVSEEKYRLLAENVSDVIWIYNISKDQYTYISSSVSQLRGYSVEEAMQQSLKESLPPESAQKISELIPVELEKFKNGLSNTFKIELQQICKDASLIWIEIITKLQWAKDGTIAALGVSRDITERKAAEQQLYANNQQLRANNQQLIAVEQQLKAALEKALESDRLKSAFLSNMSHEIRTPMNGIVGFVNLLNEPDISNNERQEYSEIINRSSQRLQNTINDLIDISKIEAGQIQVSNTEISLNKLFIELFALFNPEAISKELVLKFSHPNSAEQFLVFTDNDKLFGILSNLIKNAIKFTHQGSINLSYQIKGDFLEFFVKDTGVGIPKNRQQAIFNRFEQADIEDANAYEGSGLGLAITEAYVEMLGGEIWLLSKEGVGSEFVFTIPYKSKLTNKEIEQHIDINRQINLKFENLVILIVEDDEICSFFFQTISKGVFQEIIYAKTGKEALEICQNNSNIDVVLMDIKMPVMNGYKATREIRKFNKNVIIIAQTAYALKGDKEKAIEAGCDDYITKPLIKQELLEKIKYNVIKAKNY
ncbi:MAG: response regulator [Bacteroidales bacterium]|nr:response regulator [Bacteroidales bacterium]